MMRFLRDWLVQPAGERTRVKTTRVKVNCVSLINKRFRQNHFVWLCLNAVSASKDDIKAAAGAVAGAAAISVTILSKANWRPTGPFACVFAVN